MSLVRYQPKQGQWETTLADQQSLDWQMLVNAQVVDGSVEARAGWQIIQRPATYASAADANCPAGSSYTVATWSLAWNTKVPLGAFLFSHPDGNDWILSLWRDGGATRVYWYVTTTSGREVASGNLDGLGLSPMLADADIVLDDPLDTYCFARLYDAVLFCNGGLLWKWEPLRYMTPVPVQAFHNPDIPDTGKYMTGFVRGASIVTAHQNSVVLSGFAKDSAVSFDVTLSEGENGVPIQTNANDLGGIPVSADGKTGTLNRYIIAASDDQLPNCFSSSSMRQFATQMPTTAIASHMGRLVVWTTCETWVLVGAMSQSATWSMQPLSRGVGCAGPRAWAQSDDGLLCWVGNDGIYAWGGDGAPKDVTGPVMQLFRQGIGTFFRWAFTADSPDVNTVAQPFLRAQVQVADLASVVWVSRDNYFAISLTSGSKMEPNDLVLCWAPQSNRWWCISTYGGTQAYTYTSRGAGTGYWAAGAVTQHGLISGHHTLMVSQNEQGKLFVQGWQGTTIAGNGLARGNGALAALVGRTDQGGEPGVSVTPVDQQYGIIAVSAPVFLGDSDDKLMRRLHLQMKGLRRRIDNNDAMEVRLFFIPEMGPLDVQKQTETSSTASEQVIEAWPSCYTSNIYFYDWSGGVVQYNKWGGIIPATGIAVLTTDVLVPRWLGDEPIDLRVDIPSRVGRWFRVAVTQVSDGTWGKGFSILSAGIEVVGGYGQRR